MINEDLARENAELRTQLAEAKAALDAIRNGEVDALLISTPDGERVYTLEGADTAYRVLVENIQEGAVSLLEDGSILYCNQRFAEMIGWPLEKVLGTPFEQCLHPDDLNIYRALCRECRHGKAAGEVQLRTGSGTQLPAHLSLSVLQHQAVRGISMVVTDPSAQKRNERLTAEERLSRAILEQAAECIVVCDEQGRIIRASQEARRYYAGNPLRQPFAQVFPLVVSGGNGRDRAEAFSCEPALRGARIQNLEVLLRQGDQVLTLLVNAGPLLGRERQILGCVISLTEITARKCEPFPRLHRFQRDRDPVWRRGRAGLRLQ